MNSLIEETGKQAINLIRCCPFCAGPPHVICQGFNPILYGIKCRTCGASIPVDCHATTEAITAWNRRAGLASVGGEATRGIRSRRKLTAARRNLKRARLVRQLNRLRGSAETAYTALQRYRKMEMAELEAALEQDRAWIEQRKDVILANPILRPMYDLVGRKVGPEGSGEPRR